jgi:hypothetical protein
VQAQLAGEHHRLVDQERHLDPGLTHGRGSRTPAPARRAAMSTGRTR